MGSTAAAIRSAADRAEAKLAESNKALCATQPERFGVSDTQPERVAELLHITEKPLATEHPQRAEIASVCRECEVRDECVAVGLNVALKAAKMLATPQAVMPQGFYGTSPAQAVWLFHNQDQARRVAEAAEAEGVCPDDLAELHYAYNINIVEADTQMSSYQVAKKFGVPADVFARQCEQVGLTYEGDTETDSRPAKRNSTPANAAIREEVFTLLREAALDSDDDDESGWITQRELVDYIYTLDPSLFKSHRTHQARKRGEGLKAAAETAWVSAYQFAKSRGWIEKGKLDGKVAWRWIA